MLAQCILKVWTPSLDREFRPQTGDHQPSFLKPEPVKPYFKDRERAKSWSLNSTLGTPEALDYAEFQACKSSQVFGTQVGAEASARNVDLRSQAQAFPFPLPPNVFTPRG